MHGPVTDLALFSRPWAVDLGCITAAARVWIGTADKTVPLSAVRTLANQIPGCSCEELHGAGHLWVAVNYADVLEWIRATAHRQLAFDA
jgi:hypothetical protein